MIERHVIRKGGDDLSGSIIVEGKTKKEVLKYLRGLTKMMNEKYCLERPHDYHFVKLTDTSFRIDVHIQPHEWPCRNLNSFVFMV